jgi:hypothetical protein
MAASTAASESVDNGSIPAETVPAHERRMTGSALQEVLAQNIIDTPDFVPHDIRR